MAAKNSTPDAMAHKNVSIYDALNGGSGKQTQGKNEEIYESLKGAGKTEKISVSDKKGK